MSSSEGQSSDPAVNDEFKICGVKGKENIFAGLVAGIVFVCFFIPSFVMSAKHSSEAQTTGTNLTVWGVALLASDAIIFKYVKSLYSRGVSTEDKKKLNWFAHLIPGASKDTKSPMHEGDDQKPTTTGYKPIPQDLEENKFHFEEEEKSDPSSLCCPSPPSTARQTISASAAGHAAQGVKPRLGTISFERMRDLQKSIMKLADHFKENQTVDIRGAEDCVVEVCRAFADLPN